MGQTWRNGTDLISDAGVERPALTWLVDSVKQNPSPPNKFPQFLAAGVTSILDRAFANSRRFLNQDREKKIFDLQGKEIGSFLGDKNSLVRSTLLQSKGNYILHDGKSSQVNRINR